jgi:kynurenine formamidase
LENIVLNRVIDLSLLSLPQGTGSLPHDRLSPHIEPTGPGHPRQFVQSVCQTLPYTFPNGEIGVDVYLGDSLPHTHAECLWLEESTILGEVPQQLKWAVRDIASVPAAEWTRELSVIDLTHIDKDESPSLKVVQEAARHLRYGDYVAWYTGEHAYRAAIDIKSRPTPGIRHDVAEWLVETMGIVGIMADIPVDPVLDYGKVGAGAAKVHTYFYQNAVLMIDNTVNFDQIGDERVFLNGGVTLKTAGIGSSPARAVAIRGDLATAGSGDMVDLFTAMHPNAGFELDNPIERIEPFELQADIYRRYEIFGMQIAAEPEAEAQKSRRAPVRAKRDFGSPIRLFNSHLGTHMYLPSAPSGDLAAGTLRAGVPQLPASSDLIGPATLIDLTAVGPMQTVGKPLLQRQARDLKAGDIALLWTGFSDRYYRRPDYLSLSPRFDIEAIRWLVERGVKLIVTDAATLEPHPWELHRASEVQALQVAHRVPTVLMATNLWLLRQKRMTVSCAPTPLVGLPTTPTRVIAIEQW